MAPKPNRLLIDTDPGIDDALALLLALAAPEARIEAVTVVAGNAGLEATLRNALHTISAAGVGDPPPVVAGAARPLDRDPIEAPHIHGDDGIGGLSAEFEAPANDPAAIDASEAILETISRAPGEITVVALGPLTNLAIALLRDPATMALARRYVVMGGALRAPGNVTPSAEYNFFADPEAARIVLGARLPLTLVTLDATARAPLGRGEVERRRAAAAGPAASFAGRLLDRYFAAREGGRDDVCLLHDPLAVAAALDPSLVECERILADVETEGRLTAGMLVADLRPGAPRPGPGEGVEAAVGVDAERFLARFLDGVFGPSR